MKQQQTLSEIIKDLSQISLYIHQSTNPDKTKFSKEKLGVLESHLHFYMKKYQLPIHPIKKNIESVHYDYIRGFNHINKIVLQPIIENYMKTVSPCFSNKTEYLYKQLRRALYSYVKMNKNQKKIPQRTEVDPSFLSFVSIEELEKARNHILSPKEITTKLKQTTAGSKEMGDVLRKQTEQLIIDLRHTGFLEKLIYDEEARNHITLSKEEVERALLYQQTDCADTLALFIFWLNKYLKQWTIYQYYLFPNSIQRDILAHRNNCYDPEYIQIYENLFGVTKQEYFQSLKQFITLSVTLRDLYKFKDSCLNLLLRIQTENKKRDTLTISIDHHKEILSYVNPDTKVSASFHINIHRINKKYLQGLTFKHPEKQEQSIPKHLQVKKYQKSKFEHYI